MALIEIERKFLVVGDFKHFAVSSHKILQGYLNSDPARSVRIRIKGEKGFITIKGTSNQKGTTRFEWEKEIKVDEAEKLLQLCLPGTIEKTRYIIPFNEVIFEVDVFEGQNKGLVLAEVELESENQVFELPAWIGQEVTGDKRYYNSYLSEHPFINWKIT
jgi:adenylate cyclase